MGSLPDTRLAYIAGLFDGEGCVSIRKRSSQPGEAYSLKVQMTSVDPKLIAPLISEFGGSIRIDKKKNPKQRDAVDWRISAKGALSFLVAIRPYLISKADQADIAIAFQQAKFFRGRLPGYADQLIRERGQYRKMVALKHQLYDLSGIETVANSGNGRAGRPRAKQPRVNAVGVCNEQVPPATAKMCSELHGNMQSAAEMTALGS